MILAKLRGGLSNQMFQYAAARRLAAVHGTEVRIDTAWYDAIPQGATPRTYELDRLDISGRLASRWEVIGTDGLRNAPLHELPLALARRIRPRYRFVGESGMHFDPTILSLPDQVCLFGYWISEKYFADIEDVIRREFRFRSPPSPPNEGVMAEMQSTTSVAVHVRRGDYAANPYVTARHGLCPPSYYANAAARIRSEVTDPVFFVFSDDPAWARANLELPGRVEHVTHNQGPASAEDLRLMAYAKHNIIANSSFSWWGAWLNGNADKIVCAPERWMADPGFDTSDVIPARWERIAA